MPLKFNCPRCWKKIGASESLAGKRVKCPGCGVVIIVPTEEDDLLPPIDLSPDQTDYDFTPDPIPVAAAEPPAPPPPPPPAPPKRPPSEPNLVAAGTSRGTQRRHKLEYLLRKEILTADQLTEASRAADKEGLSLPEILLDRYGVEASDLSEAMTQHYGCEAFRFDASIVVPPDLRAPLDPAYLRTHGWCPVGRRDEAIVVAMIDPGQVTERDEIQRLLKAQKFVVQVALRGDLEQLIDACFHRVDKKGPQVQAIVERMIGEAEEEASEEPSDRDLSENNSEVVRLVHSIISEAQEEGASDIHIEPNGSKSVVVRYRVDGECADKSAIPGRYARAIISRIKIMSGLDIAERRKPQDGKIRLKFKDGRQLELRVAIVPTSGGNEDAVLRLLSASKAMPLDALGLDGPSLATLRGVCDRPYGLVLVVGPTGSGKTTTLHALLGHMNVREQKIWTAEDPVEITQAGLRQVQVQPKIGVSFASTLRSFLRADPDVIMVGEMRDAETATIAVEASLTGHLVLSTLHTNNAPETVTRLLEMGVDTFSFADSLILVLAQRLVRGLCAQCRVSHPATASEIGALTEEHGAGWERLDPRPAEGIPLHGKGPGCDACRQNGYKGRLAITELMMNGERLRGAIYRKEKAAVLREIALEEGMRTLKQDGIRKVLQGLTDLGQVLAAASE